MTGQQVRIGIITQNKEADFLILKLPCVSCIQGAPLNAVMTVAAVVRFRKQILPKPWTAATCYSYSSAPPLSTVLGFWVMGFFLGFRVLGVRVLGLGFRVWGYIMEFGVSVTGLAKP